MAPPARAGIAAALWLAALACVHLAQQPAAPPQLALHLDYDGAERLIAALERDSLPPRALDTLLAVPGVGAMVDNVTRFIPGVGREEFRRRAALFARTKRRDGPATDFMQLTQVWGSRDTVQRLVHDLRASEGEIVRGTLRQLGRYAPPTGPLDVRVYFVAGGVSFGFVPDDSTTAFYINLTRADGDLGGVTWNMAHEAYHVMQKAAARRVPSLRHVADAPQELPLPERLVATTLMEGTASYATDPARTPGAGPRLTQARASYLRNTQPDRLLAHFARFDSVLARVADRASDWEAAYGAGFTGDDPPFYFVGFAISAALDSATAGGAIRTAFSAPPAEFFRQYIRLYHANARAGPHFSPRTEAIIRAMP
ncbi:MAG: hypothetical protein JWO05_3645 [Gemmatimonadetes bacterium]|nr:hypothetical protein [Gemmatimonadota bacterium]